MNSATEPQRATLIDGKAFASGLLARIAAATSNLACHGIQPGLAVVLVGDDPASEVYVRSKIRETAAAGMRSFHFALSAEVSQDSLLALIAKLNSDDAVDGILVQLPLPPHINNFAVIAAIHPDKDVDGFNPTNVGRLAIGAPSFTPCTPLGCLLLIKSLLPSLAGVDAVVVGKSNIVGKPMAQLLMREGCTVTVAHSLTRDTAEVCRRADLLVVAAGRPGLVKRHWIKPGAILIDVGINRVDAGGGKTKLVGDVLLEEAVEVASAVTPVPGGVGPMTIACLLRNTLEATCRKHSVPMPNV